MLLFGRYRGIMELTPAAINWIIPLLWNLLGGLVFGQLNAQRLKQIVHIGMLISGILMIF